MIAEYTSKQGRNLMELRPILFQEKRLIFVDRQITTELASDIIEQLLYLAHLSSDDITLLINSPGGSVSDGLAILDTMHGIDCDVRTICIGTAASMAAVLLAGGTKGKRFAMPNAEVMIHQVMGGAQGQAADITIAARHINRTKTRLNAMLSEYTNRDIEQIAIDTDRDNFMSAQEAIEYGLVDGIKYSFC